MNFVTLLALGIGLAMDAFAASICKGLSLPKTTLKSAVIVGLWFGGFQALMPLIGYFLGARFHALIENLDHWVAFALLLLIGANMIRESFSAEENENDASLSFRTMLLLALATSIDALAVGIALSMDAATNIWAAISVIGVTTFVLSAIGVKLGNLFGCRFRRAAELFGGVVLILIGLKILLEHLGILAL
ncbi:MAG: manganese efflux pump [Clostridia bacterium]|nr:manganese efflux pump [Clostridia bacterium]